MQTLCVPWYVKESYLLNYVFMLSECD